jgi:hypothetical protein
MLTVGPVTLMLPAPVIVREPTLVMVSVKVPVPGPTGAAVAVLPANSSALAAKIPNNLRISFSHFFVQLVTAWDFPRRHEPDSPQENAMRMPTLTTRPAIRKELVKLLK